MENFALILIFGALFGIIIQYAGLNRFNVISGQALLKDNTVAKTILLTIGVGAVLLSIMTGIGVAAFHVKPFLTGGIILGGLIFGAGMAVLGYCPSTLAISLGEGSVDALMGIVGGLIGGFVFTLLFPALQHILGPDLGKVSLYSVFGGFTAGYYIVIVVIGAVFTWFAFFIHKLENSNDKKWMVSGVSLAFLNTVVFLSATTNRPIGASTSYPYLADLITGFTHNSYFEKIAIPGHWEVIFLFGAMIAAMFVSIAKKEFRLRLIHSNWEKYKGGSVSKRIAFALLGGFLLIFGARMAGGCTSGHIISGGMQIAFSSLTFGAFMFAGLVITGKVFYGEKK